ncbi:MAG: hypothetical protein J6I49_05430 [Bacteroidales bacterium]|nr:hypothetical protein [Bacteroidales bacterium]
MSKKNKLVSKSGYEWKFGMVGGVTRVNIETAEDIAHLYELDQKLWTVLSCPVKGLEFDEKTLAMLDADKDGRLRVNEVVAAAEWLKKVLKDLGYVLQGKDSIAFADVQADTEEGRQVIDSARLILKALGLEKEEISLAEVTEYMAVFEEKCRAEYTAQNAEPFEPPFGEKSDEAEAAVNAVRSKVADYFMRCKLVQFDEEATAALDVQVERIAAISGSNLNDNLEEISTYPLARPGKEAMLPLAEGLNPAWKAAIVAVKDLAGLEGDSIGEEAWNELLGKVDAYMAWKAAGETAMNEAVAARLEEHSAAFAPVEKLLRLCRDFFTLLHNYVVFKDFYNRAPGTEAVFQAGQLYIDQRCCELCVKVTDMGKQLASAGLSGMYILYCHCVSKAGLGEMDIAAVVTAGDIRNFREGKNGVFYDRSGQDWDATVTKIVDNPISVGQAFWSPYRKFGNWVTDKINKSAEEKESKQFDDMTAKADTASTDLAVQAADGKPADAVAAPKPAFDIAKFAGIFAAIGLAVGAVGMALAAVAKFLVSAWYNPLIAIALVVVVVSGPSMLLAWLKLRKRNLGPVLNANGWAINSMVKVNTTFGALLTSVAKYPKVVGKDPLADKKMAWWKKCLIWIVVLALLALGVFKLTQHRWPWQPVPVVEEVEAAAEEAEAEATVAAEDIAVDEADLGTEEPVAE